MHCTPDSTATRHTCTHVGCDRLVWIWFPSVIPPWPGSLWNITIWMKSTDSQFGKQWIVYSIAIVLKHFYNNFTFHCSLLLFSFFFKCVSKYAIIIMYIYHALINALSAHIIDINLNMIFYTHVKHSPTKTIYLKKYILFFLPCLPFQNTPPSLKRSRGKKVFSQKIIMTSFITVLFSINISFLNHTLTPTFLTASTVIICWSLKNAVHVTAASVLLYWCL